MLHHLLSIVADFIRIKILFYFTRENETVGGYVSANRSSTVGVVHACSNATQNNVPQAQQHTQQIFTPAPPAYSNRSNPHPPYAITNNPQMYPLPPINQVQPQNYPPPAQPIIAPVIHNHPPAGLYPTFPTEMNNSDGGREGGMLNPEPTPTGGAQNAANHQLGWSKKTGDSYGFVRPQN